MIRGLYSSATAMLAQKTKMENTANNIANVSTPGFKKELLSFTPLEENALVRRDGAGGRNRPLGSTQSGVTVAEVHKNWQPGPVVQTNLPTNLALGGNGFFELELRGEEADKQIAYTRNGSFLLNAQGYLVTPEGYVLKGENGPVQVAGENFTVTEKGDILTPEGAIANKIRVASFAEYSLLENSRGGYFAAPPGTEPAQEKEPMVRQGFLEKSNVNILEEMVDMLSVARNYQLNQKVMQTHDEITSKTVNEVGSLK